MEVCEIWGIPIPMFWNQIEEQREWNASGKKKGANNNGMDDDSSEEDVDKLVIYRQILEILKPGENVLKVCKAPFW